MNTKNNRQLLKNLEIAVKRENSEEIAEILAKLPDVEPPISTEEFIKKIKQTTRKERTHMKIYPTVKTAAAAAAVTALFCATAFAAVEAYKQYTFMKDNTYVTVTSNEELSEEEAEKLADDAVKDFEKAKEDAANYSGEGETPESVGTYETFETVEEIEEAYNIKIATPTAAPDIALSDITGSVMSYSDAGNETTAWLTYGDPDEKAYFITFTEYSFEGGAITSVTGADAAPTGETYTSETGFTYDILNDSDEETERTAKIYITGINNRQYAIGFVGFDDAEAETVVNSIDLSLYK